MVSGVLEWDIVNLSKGCGEQGAWWRHSASVAFSSLAALDDMVAQSVDICCYLQCFTGLIQARLKLFVVANLYSKRSHTEDLVFKRDELGGQWSDQLE